MDRKKIIASCLVFLFLYFPVYNQNSWKTSSLFANDSKIDDQDTYNNQLNFNFSTASKELSSKSSFRDFNFYLLKINYLWWDIIAGNDEPENIETFYRNLDDAEIKNSENENNNCPINQMIIESYRIRTAFLLKNELSLYTHLRNFNALYAEYLQDKNGQLSEMSNLVSSLNNYFNYYIAISYPFLYSMFIHFSYPDKDTSINQLIELNHSDNFFIKTESYYFLMKIYYDCEQDYIMAEKYAEYLVHEFPGNFIFSY